MVLGLIPDGSEVNQASSKTVDDLGIGQAIIERDEYIALKPRIWSMDRATQGKQIRQLGAAPDVMVGSVHAITEDGQIVTASASGSQVTAYAGGAGQVVYVVGSQKLVPDLDTAFQRIEEYVFPLEDARAQAAYGMHSAINQLLIVRGDLPGPHVGGAGQGRHRLLASDAPAVGGAQPPANRSVASMSRVRMPGSS